MPDTSCIVALILPNHVHHDACARELSQRLTDDETMVVSAHAMVESYSALTRMPPPNRVPPHLALAALRANFVDDIELVAPGAESVIGMLELASLLGVAGGAIYDFLIAQTAVGSGVNTLLTMNGRHFERFALPLRVVVPGS